MEEQNPQIDPALIWRKVDENTVIVTPQSGEMRVLNGVGSKIWQLLAEGQTKEAIVEQIVAEYNISAEQASTDLEKFLVELAERNLLIGGA
jgi:hypothetical protein